MIRVLVHAHSIWSYDSKLTLANWVKLAHQLSLSAVLLSEHEETGWTPKRYADYVAACHAASTKDVKLIPGIEFNQDGFHLLCYGLRYFPLRPSSITQLADAVRAQGCWLCLAHPGKYQWRYPHSLLQVVDGVEVWNSKWIYDGTVGPHPRSVKLAQGKVLLVGQDVHRLKHLSALYIETATADILTDLLSGRYWIVLDNSRWTPKQLIYRPVAGLVQRCRTATLRAGLAVYRWTFKR